MRAIARDNREGQVVPLSSALDRVEGGAEVLAAVQRAREEIRRRRRESSRRARHHRQAVRARCHLAHSSGRSEVRGGMGKEEDQQDHRTGRTGRLSRLFPRGRRRDSAAVERKRECRSPHDRSRRQGSGISPRLHSPRQPRLVPELLSRRRWSRSPANCATRIPSTEADDKTLHNQEERRLFYVAMTRARDSLHIYAKEGTRQERQQESRRLHARI